jgi:quinol monooxygenase YgiN
MSKMMMRVTVEDYAKWKPVFDGLSKTRKEFGSQGGHLFRSANNPNEITILFDWADVKKAKDYAQSDVLKEAMRKAGVIGKPDALFSKR